MNNNTRSRFKSLTKNERSAMGRLGLKRKSTYPKVARCKAKGEQN